MFSLFYFILLLTNKNNSTISLNLCLSYITITILLPQESILDDSVKFHFVFRLHFLSTLYAHVNYGMVKVRERSADIMERIRGSGPSFLGKT